MFKEANQRGCICEDGTNIIHLTVEEQLDGEIESLDVFYCMSCNSFWREP